MSDSVLKRLVGQVVNDSQNVSQVIADYFLSTGNPKGELIMLEHALQDANGNTAEIEEKRKELIGNTNIKLPLYLPQFYLDQNKYKAVTGKPYAKAVHKLRRTCEEKKNLEHPMLGDLYRPLTSEETIEARVVDYWTLKDSNGKLRTKNQRLRLFNDYQDSCTGIAYQKGTTKFKIDLECNNLIMINENFNAVYLPVNYAEFPGEELDSKDGIYNNDLTFQQFLEHPGHSLAIPDKTLRKAHGEIVFAERNNQNSLGFYVLQNTDKDQLRSWCVLILGYRSIVFGYSLLDYFCRLLSVAQ